MWKHKSNQIKSNNQFKLPSYLYDNIVQILARAQQQAIEIGMYVNEKIITIRFFSRENRRCIAYIIYDHE